MHTAARAVSIAWVIAFGLAAAPRPTAAQAPPARSVAPPPTATRPPLRTARVRPFRVHPAIDGPIAAVAAGTWAGTQSTLQHLVTPSCPCARTEVIPFDRWLAGHRDATVARAADVMLGATLVTTVSFLLADLGRSRELWPEVLEDLTVIAEAVLLSGLTNQIIKLAVRRPRPFMYGLPAGDPALAEPDNYLSFYSAHSSTAFAAGIALATVYARRHPTSPARWALYAGAAVAGTLVGALRVASGWHFLSDVLTGAVLGTAAGYLVPLAHARPGAPAIAVSADAHGAVLTARWAM